MAAYLDFLGNLAHLVIRAFLVCLASKAIGVFQDDQEMMDWMGYLVKKAKLEYRALLACKAKMVTLV